MRGNLSDLSLLRGQQPGCRPALASGARKQAAIAASGLWAPCGHWEMLGPSAQAWLLPPKRIARCLWVTSPKLVRAPGARPCFFTRSQAMVRRSRTHTCTAGPPTEMPGSGLPRLAATSSLPAAAGSSAWNHAGQASLSMRTPHTVSKPWVMPLPSSSSFFLRPAFGR